MPRFKTELRRPAVYKLSEPICPQGLSVCQPSDRAPSWPWPRLRLSQRGAAEELPEPWGGRGPREVQMT